MTEHIPTEESEINPAVAARMAAARAARAAKKAAETPVAETAPAVSSEVAALEQPVELPAGPTLMEKAAANEHAQRLAKIAALRAAKMSNADPVSEPRVTVRILKKGHGLVSMGEHISGLGDLTYDFGETPSLPQSIATDLENRGLVEIQ